MNHNLKCLPEFFVRLQSGQKTFECRKNDRDYQVGDCLTIGCETFTAMVFTVKYILHGPGFGIEAGHCVMSIQREI